jgi:hypothetical protein
VYSTCFNLYRYAVGLYEGVFRTNIEETGMGFDKEVEMIAEARRLGLLTTPYAFTPGEAAAMAGAGADIVVVGLYNSRIQLACCEKASIRYYTPKHPIGHGSGNGF